MQPAARPDLTASLLELPEPCLQAVLQCCASYPGTLLSAARVHSRLHALAVPALSSVEKASLTQEQADSLQLYLARHGQHVSSISLQGVLSDGHRSCHQIPAATLHQLPHGLGKLSSLALEGLALQVQPGSGHGGVLHCAGMAPLKHLRLSSCLLLDGEEHLAAALAQLTGLELLAIHDTRARGKDDVDFPFDVLPCLQQLTCLDLKNCHRGHGWMHNPADGLQHLRALPGLKDLRVDLGEAEGHIYASMLTGLTQLTRLDLASDAVVFVESAALAGMTQLRHLRIFIGFFDTDSDDGHDLEDQSVGVAQVLPHLLRLDQLTHLDLGYNANEFEEGGPPAAAYAALTASTKLQHLNISHWVVPQAAWRHMFPASLLLPDLRLLDISCITQPGGGGPIVAPEGTRLVSCCPGLQSLSLQGWDCTANLLGPLQQLSGLSCLGVSVWDASDVALVAQLTGFGGLEVQDCTKKAGGVLQLTQLQHLTRLKWERHSELELKCEAPGDEPVWRQLLRHHLDHSDPEVARQAAEGLQ